MPSVKVKIEWDVPDYKNWLNAFNIGLALSKFCKNTKFKVTEIASKEEED